ncbi:MAG: homoserine O-acetyltransferase [Thermoanaerobaculia bacterium]|nr:homoserine O-acetyltransferase [Thermoanaerobaculia bacterium]
MTAPIGAKRFQDDSGLEVEFGGRLPQLEIAYETWGQLSRQKDNAILLCPAFSGHSHANSHEGDPSPGWWEGMVGSGLAFDTEDYFVVCASLLGGSYGTTGPWSVNPETGEAWRGRFPVVGVRDLVDAHIRLLDHLGIERLFCVAGGSLGAMQALELGVRYPQRVRKVFTASGTDRTRPHTAAIRHVGRQAILLDPKYCGGDYEGNGPTDGLALAREIGTVFYRSREELNQRFRWQPIAEPSRGGTVFDVQSYLRHQGQKILGDFDANSYLTLSLAMDLFDVWRGFPSRESALEPVEAEFMIVGVDEDRLIPIDEQEWLHHALVTAGKRSHWRPIENHIGHDWFLVEIDQITELVRELLK